MFSNINASLLFEGLIKREKKDFYFGVVMGLGVCDTANFGIDPIPSKYRASIADTNPDTDTWHLKKTYI